MKTKNLCITLRWRTRPDNQAEIDVYQSVSDGIDIPGVDACLRTRW
jgi:hypothetical protein